LVHRLLRSLQVLNERVDAVNGQRIKALRYMLAVAFDFDTDLLACVTHGSPLEVRREHAALSVIDRPNKGSTIFGRYHISPIPDIKTGE
jgi:hypothetical protein